MLYKSMTLAVVCIDMTYIKAYIYHIYDVLCVGVYLITWALFLTLPMSDISA